MMQSCASAAKLRGGGPILNRGSMTMCEVGFPPPRIVICSSASIRSRAAECSVGILCKSLSGRRTKAQSSWRLAGGDEAPERNEQLARQRHNHGLARADASIRRARPIPLGQRALLLMQQKAPSELDHPAADPGIAGSGKSSLASLLTALVRRSG